MAVYTLGRGKDGYPQSISFGSRGEVVRPTRFSFSYTLDSCSIRPWSRENVCSTLVATHRDMGEGCVHLQVGGAWRGHVTYAYCGWAWHPRVERSLTDKLETS